MTWKSALENHPEYARAIGMVSVESANLEASLANLLAATLFIPKRIAHAIFFTPRGAALRLDIAKAAIEAALRTNPESDSPLDKQKTMAAKQATRLFKRSYAISQRRHDVMHDAWGASANETGEIVVWRTKTTNLLEPQRLHVQLSELNNLVREFRVLIDEVDALTIQFRDNPPSMAHLRRSWTN